MLPCALFPENADLNSLFRSPALQIRNDWSGNPVPFNVDFYFGHNRQKLFFGAVVEHPPVLAPRLTSDSFVEGLWNYDVLELFLKDDHSDSYQEFNLSPDRRWWSSVFRTYRIRDEEHFRRLVPEVGGIYEQSRFRAGITIPRDELSVSFGVQASCANIAAIFGMEPRCYLSYHRAATAHPDFHRPECMQPITPA